MFDFRNSTITIIGLGLMGGAIAEGLRKINAKNLWAVDLNKKSLQRAEALKIIDRGFCKPKEALKNSDIIIICLYPSNTIEFIKNNMHFFKKNAVITDIVGIKRYIISEVEGVLRDDLDFIGGHPMAGKEQSGFGYADSSIFKGRNYIITPTTKNKHKNILMVENLAKSLGFETIVKVDAETHDQRIAFTSQLCHVLAAALIYSNNDEDINNFEGGSFRDLTRIAMINSHMWTELFMKNKDMLLDEIYKFQNSINIIKKFIENNNSDDLITLFDIVRRKKEILDNK